MNLVRGELFPTISDKIILHYDNHYCDPNTILDNQIVYCDTHYILKYKDILNLRKNLTIITHNSDHCLCDSDEGPNNINVNELTCYTHWYGQNVYSTKVTPIPIGFENLRWETVFGPKTHWLENARNNDDSIFSSKPVYLNCNFNTNIYARQDCYNEVSKSKIVDIDYPNLTYHQYLKRIQEHMFTLSPRGNGLDCHRTWEILMMRRVPIIKREGQLEKLYSGLPVLFVDNWSDIHNTDLKDAFKQFSFENQDYLEFDFWKNKIQQL